MKYLKNAAIILAIIIACFLLFFIVVIWLLMPSKKNILPGYPSLRFPEVNSVKSVKIDKVKIPSGEHVREYIFNKERRQVVFVTSSSLSDINHTIKLYRMGVADGTIKEITSIDVHVYPTEGHLFKDENDTFYYFVPTFESQSKILVFTLNSPQVSSFNTKNLQPPTIYDTDYYGDVESLITQALKLREPVHLELNPDSKDIFYSRKETFLINDAMKHAKIKKTAERNVGLDYDIDKYYELTTNNNTIHFKTDAWGAELSNNSYFIGAGDTVILLMYDQLYIIQ